MQTYVRYNNEKGMQILTFDPCSDMSLGDLFKKNPHKDVLWFEISFSLPPLHLDNIGCISLGYDAQKLKAPVDYTLSNIMLAKVCEPVRLEFKFSLEPLLQYTKESYLQTAYILEKQIWKYDIDVLQLFDAKDLSVTWSHPDIAPVKADVEIDFKIDCVRVAFLTFNFTFLPTKNHRIMTLGVKKLYSMTQRLSDIVLKIISATGEICKQRQNRQE